MSQRQAFIDTVSKLLDEDEKIVLLLGDISVYAFRTAAARYPHRVLNMGCAEQATIGFAAGLALSGLYPIFHTIDPFIARRAYEQVYLDFGHQKLTGLFVTVGHDRDYANLGPSHHGDHCADLMWTVPRMAVWEPKSDDEAARYIDGACTLRALSYVRLRA